MKLEVVPPSLAFIMMCMATWAGHMLKGNLQTFIVEAFEAFEPSQVSMQC